MCSTQNETQSVSRFVSVCRRPSLSVCPASHVATSPPPTLRGLSRPTWHPFLPPPQTSHTCVSHFGTFPCRQSLCLLLIRNTATPTHIHTIAHMSGLFFPIFPIFQYFFCCSSGRLVYVLWCGCYFFSSFLPCLIVHLMPICCVFHGADNPMTNVCPQTKWNQSRTDKSKKSRRMRLFNWLDFLCTWT